MTLVSDGLRRQIWITKGCRFNAHARLLAISSASNTSITFLSFYVVLLSLASLVYGNDIPYFINTSISFLSVAISIFIIILTLMESAKNTSVNAERMHKCGIELLSLYNEYNNYIAGVRNKDTDTQYIRQYNMIIARYPENHDEVDFIGFQISHPDDFSIGATSLNKLKWKHKVKYAKFFFTYTIITALPLILAIISATVYTRVPMPTLIR